jgi:hypothetical protein
VHRHSRPEPCQRRRGRGRGSSVGNDVAKLFYAQFIVQGHPSLLLVLADYLLESIVLNMHDYLCVNLKETAVDVVGWAEVPR